MRIFAKDNRPRKKTLWDLFWHVIKVHNDLNSMRGYIRENLSCEIMEKLPSRPLIKRYNLNLEYSDPLVWWLLENYFNGNLVEKQQVENAD